MTDSLDLSTTCKLVGVVPAAGMGRRLFPYPHAKELFPVGYQEIEIDGHLEKRPKVISQYLIENMIAGGARQFYFVLGYGKHDIMSYYGSGRDYGVQVAYLFQDELRGMPYAIDLVTPWLQGNEITLMGMPDTIVEPKDAFHRLIDAHGRWQADLTLGLFRTCNPSKFGMVGIDTDCNVVKHVDKPTQTDLEWLWGIACWGQRFAALMHTSLSCQHPVEREVVLGDMFDAAMAQGLRVKGLPFEDGHYIDIGTYDDLKQALESYA
jgi:glucose-1-phosphate thymidylyltransferase